MKARVPVLLLAVVGQAFVARAQRIPIRQLASFEVSSPVRTDPVVWARALSDGRLVVTPLVGLHVLLLEASLASARVIADTSMLTPGRYAINLVTVPYLGDSTLLGDQFAGVFLLLDPDGRKVGTVAPPRNKDAGVLTGTVGSGAALDPSGRLVYRGLFPLGSPKFVNGRVVLPLPADSFPIVRADFDARLVDTLAVVLMPSGARDSFDIPPEGQFTMRRVVQPLPTTDEWALLTDGTLAIVRGHDYHVDLVRRDGSRASMPKMPFDWRRLTDDERRTIVDSMRPFLAAADSIGKATGRIPRAMISEVVPASELPDYYPPLKAHGVRADRDGKLWILPSTSAQARGGLLYDVVDGGGALTERVQLPTGCALAGFAPHNVVYLNCAGPDGEFHLKKTRVIR